MFFAPKDAINRVTSTKNFKILPKLEMLIMRISGLKLVTLTQ